MLLVTAKPVRRRVPGLTVNINHLVGPCNRGRDGTRSGLPGINRKCDTVIAVSSDPMAPIQGTAPRSDSE